MNILVIGANDTGKTHFVGQLFGRLRQGGASLRLRSAPSNLSALEEVLERLNEGRTASHTSSDIYHEIDLPLATEAGSEFNLLFPDYGGEQIKNLVTERATTSDWAMRLRQSEGWLFFIRLSLVNKPEDLWSRPPGNMLDAPHSTKKSEEKEQNDGAKPEKPLSAATFVELLQALLSFSGRGIITKRRAPVLAIVLSCWDEVEKTEAAAVESAVPPLEVLRQKLPLLAEFVTANWKEDSLLVYGLSALGKPLRDNVSDEEYLDRGPESFGYVITPGGELAKDLTIPLTDLLNLIDDAN